MKLWLFLSIVLHFGVLAILLFLPPSKTVELKLGACVTCDDSIIHGNDFIRKTIPKEHNINKLPDPAYPISLQI